MAINIGKRMGIQLSESVAGIDGCVFFLLFACFGMYPLVVSSVHSIMRHGQVLF